MTGVKELAGQLTVAASLQKNHGGACFFACQVGAVTGRMMGETYFLPHTVHVCERDLPTQNAII